jgi:hypothetical protein
MAPQSANPNVRNSNTPSTNTTNAQCLGSSQLAQSFTQYVQQCRTSTGDVSRTNNMFPVARAFKNNFTDLRSQFDDMLTTGNSMSALANLSGATVSGADQQIRQLEEKKGGLLSEINKQRRISESADRTFLEDIMNGTPQQQTAPTLQDVTLLLFWFGWLTLTILLVYVRWASPGGGWKSGLFTLALLAFVTICVYALLIRVA